MRLLNFTYLSVLLSIFFKVFSFQKFWLYSLYSVNVFSVYFMFFMFSGLYLAVVLYFIISTRVWLLFGLFIALVFPIFLYFFLFYKNIFIFFFFYECFVIPSICIILFFSPNRRFLMANIYFIMWTQVGSFLVLLAIMYIYLVYNTVYIQQITNSLPLAISLFIFFGFGVKIPVWPFHFWLTKTHVEAPTFFSIYLSGFLVKTALIGLILFVGVFHVIVNYLAIIIAIIGIIDATFKIMAQVDIKKVVAYATIQEMNIIVLFIFFNNSSSYIYMNFFVLTHTILSTLLFYFVDILYKRFKARTISSVNGLLANNNFIGLTLVMLVILYLGFPGSIKFYLEVKLFMWVLFINKYLFIILILGLLWVGSVTFARIWFGVVFGLNLLKKSVFFTKKDALILYFNFALYMLLPYFSYLY